MNRTWLMVGVAIAAVAPAHAQNVATVREIVRVVKAGRAGTNTLFDAKIGTTLNTGDRVRTAGRSAAGVRFPDKSILRLGELTEVVLAGGKAQVLRGQVVADYKRPGTISSGYAVAAVRGTVVHFLVDEAKQQAQVNCYEGRVFVSSADNPINAGSSVSVTPTQLTDPALQGDPSNWTGARIQFVDGPYSGESRRITAFDSATGTVTWAPPLPNAPAGAEHGYLLVTREDRGIVELRNNQGTLVPRGQSPGRPFGVPAKEFAMLQQYPYFRQLADGREVLVYPNTDELERQKRETLPNRDAIQRGTRRPRVLSCGHVLDGAEGSRQHRLVCQAAGVRAAVAQQFARDTPAPPLPPTREQRILPGNIYPTVSAEAVREQKVAFLVEPFAIASDETDAVGARLRFQAVSGNVYSEAGYRYSRTEGRNLHDVSEAFVHVRGRYGDVIVGRQHVFPGPSNNTNIGTLLGLETTDAAIYEAPLRRGYRQQVGYISDTQALRRGGTRGFYARGLAPVLKGNVGYSILGSTEDGAEVGWSLDGAQSLIPNVLDIYGEGGESVRGRALYTAGFYVPALYHSAKVDLFLEYARREGVRERVSLRLRRELGNRLVVIGFVDQDLGSSYFTAGGGVLYSHRFK